MKRLTGVFCAGLLALVSTACDRPSQGTDITQVHKLQFKGAIEEDADLSAVALLPGGLAIGSDEVGSIQFLAKKTELLYEVKSTIDLNKGEEIDIEALASSGSTLYVLGSHSYKRKKPKDDKKHSKNRKRLATVEEEKTRDAIYKLTVSKDGQGSEIKKINLRDLLNKDKYLGLFAKVPSKENGIDIEGLAVHEGKLFAGFRGPVLRENHTPVMVFSFDKPSDYELRFVNLQGQGIRDIQRVKDGFLVLSGPVGDAPEPGHLFFWDGKDGVIGKDREVKAPRKLGRVPGKAGAKAEGLAILEETKDQFKVLIVYDSAKNGDPTVFSVKK